MDLERLRKLGEAIGGKLISRVPQGGNPAGLVAYYQSRRIESMPLLESISEASEERGAMPIDSSIPRAPQLIHDPATVSG